MRVVSIQFRELNRKAVGVITTSLPMWEVRENAANLVAGCVWEHWRELNPRDQHEGMREESHPERWKDMETSPKESFFFF